MATDPKSTPVAKKQVVQPPRNNAATSTPASKTAKSGGVARQGTNEPGLKPSQNLVKNETRQKAETSNPITAKKDLKVGEKAATKPRGLNVQIVTTKTILDLLKLFNHNDNGLKPTVYRSPGEIADLGGREKTGKNVMEKKVANQTPTKNGEKKIPLR